MIFLTLSRMTDIRERGIYTDLMRKFREEGHRVYIIFPEERRFHQSTSFVEQEGIHLLGVRTLNIQKTHIVEKGIGTILLESQFKRAIRKYLPDVRPQEAFALRKNVSVQSAAKSALFFP